MLHKLMLRTWAGPLPDWTPQFLEHVQPLKEYGWKFKILHLATPQQLAEFRQKVKERLGAVIEPLEPGSRKVCEFDPALAAIFPELVEGFDFWGHFNLDCVYGRLDRWIPDEFLAGVDIYGDDPRAVCGPFTVYRNTPFMNSLFERSPRWIDIFQHRELAGFDEGEFSETVRQAHAAGQIRFRSGSNHSHDKIEGHRYQPQLSMLPDGSLMEFGVTETMFFHFNGTRRWPLS